MEQKTRGELRKEAICEFIADLSDKQKVDLWNNYCYENNSIDNRIYPNTEDEFNEMYRNDTPYHIALEVADNRFNTCDDYIVFTIYGPTTFNYLDDKASPYCEGDMLARKSSDDLLDMLREIDIDWRGLNDMLWDIDYQGDEEEDESEDE